MTDSMLEQTMNKLAAVKGIRSRRVIADEAGIEYEWLQKLAQGHIADPGVKKIERLHNYLSENELPDDCAQPAA